MAEKETCKNINMMNNIMEMSAKQEEMQEV